MNNRGKRLIIFLIFSFALQSCENKTQTTKEHSEKTAETHTVSENGIISFCRFAKIVDKDGYVNVREKESANSKIIGKIKSGEVVFIFEDLDTDWLSVSYESKEDVSGYIHRSRIKYINSFEQIPVKYYHDYSAVFVLNNDIYVDIKTSTFDYEANEKYFSEATYEDFAYKKYKGKEMWGTDGTIPKTFYQSITAIIGKQEIKIPESAIEDLFNANNEYAECYYDNADNTIYIHLSNSDGAGSYVALFKIENGVYKGRQIEIPF